MIYIIYIYWVRRIASRKKYINTQLGELGLQSGYFLEAGELRPRYFSSFVTDKKKKTPVKLSKKKIVYDY